MNIVRFKKVFLSIAVFLIVGSAVVIGIKGVTLGTEFTGGALLGVTTADKGAIPSDKQAALLADSYTTLSSQVSAELCGTKCDLGTGLVTIPVDASTFEIKLQSEKEFAVVKEEIKKYPEFVVAYETVVGPSLGKELVKKSVIALILVLLAILVFIAFAFGGIDEARKKYGLGPSSWMYGGAALLALLHDVLIPTAIFVLLGKEVTSLFVVGMLSILGLSVSDTIVVFDRIRERMRTAKEGTTFSDLVGNSISDTFTRSINTSVTLMLTLAALLVFGPAATHDLALVMLLGAFFGTYSSIFVASPLLTLFKGKKQK